MKTMISDVYTFKSILLSVIRFTGNAHLDVRRTGIRIRSIDQHDFCHSEVHFTPEFFEGYNIDGKTFSFSVNTMGLRNILGKIRNDNHLLLEITQGRLRIRFGGKRKTTYDLEWFTIDHYEFPELPSFNYRIVIDIPSTDFLHLIREASAVSPELHLLVGNGKLKAACRDGHLSYTTEIGLRNQMTRLRPLGAFVIVDYLKNLSEIMNLCDSVNIGMGEETPLKISFIYNGVVSLSFLVSNRKTTEKRGNNLILMPDAVSTKLPGFIQFIGKFQRGTKATPLSLSLSETDYYDYTRLAVALGLAKIIGGNISITREGKILVSLLQEKPDMARKELHNVALKKIVSYAVLINSLHKRSLTTTEIYEKVNSELKSRSIPQIDKEELMNLLGMGTWCRMIYRKVGLYYFGK